MITLENIPRPNPEVASQILDGEAVLVHPKKGKVKVLNAVGAEIWQAIDGKLSIAEIAHAISSDYGLAQEIAEKDTINFLNSLLSNELITYDNA